MLRLYWWTAIVLLLISQSYAAELTKSQESELKVDAKDLLKAASSSAEYSASLANDYTTSEKQSSQDTVAASSSVSTSVDSGSYQNDQQPQYSQPLSYSQPGTPVQPIHSYSQPLNYPPQALPYTSESQQISHQYGSVADQANAGQSQQYPSIKELQMPEIPSASASSNYYPQYPAHQAYQGHLGMQHQASAPVSDYQTSSQAQSADQYDANQQQANSYAQSGQSQNVYLQNQHNVNIPGSSYSEQSYAVEDKNTYPQASSYSQPLPPEYSQPADYSHSGNVPSIPVKPKKTVILAIPVKLVAKNKYQGQNNGGYQSAPQESQPHYSTNVVPAAANLPVAHSMEKNNYNNYENDKPTSFQEKPLYADKPAYTDKVEDYPKYNHNLNNNLQGNNNGGYNGEYEGEGDRGYNNLQGNNNNGGYNGGQRYNNGPHKPMYNPGREVKPLSNYQTTRHRGRPSYGPNPEIYGPANHGPEYTTDNGPVEEIIQDHGGYSVGGELEHNHIHALPALHHKHKINEIYESPVDHLPPPYIPSDFPSLSGPSLGGLGLHGLGNPMDLIYSSPYKLSGGPPKHGPSGGGYGGLRPSLLGSASSPSATSTSSASNYGQFLSSLLSAYSLGGLKPSASKPSSSSKGGLASYLNNLPGLDLLKGYSSSLSPSYSNSFSNSLLSSASGMNKYYLPKPTNKQPPYLGPIGTPLGWPTELTQQSKPSKPTGLLSSSSNIVSSMEELFKSSPLSSLNPTSKFKRPLYSDATRAITNLYKKFLN